MEIGRKLRELRKAKKLTHGAKRTKRRTFESRTLPFWIAAFYAISFTGCAVKGGTALQPFSADVTHIVDKQTSTGKIYTTGNAVRTEYETGVKGQKGITIVRLDHNEFHGLGPAGNTDIERPYVDDTGTSEAEFVSYMDGAETQRKSMGADQIGPYHCEKFRVQVTYKGHVYSIIEWAAKELDGFVVKRGGEQGKWSIEYSNVQLGPQDASLFKIPPAYKTIEYSRDWSAVVGQLDAASGPDHSKLISVARAAGLKVSGDDPALISGSHPRSSHYSLQFVDPITGSEVMSVNTDID